MTIGELMKEIPNVKFLFNLFIFIYLFLVRMERIHN